MVLNSQAAILSRAVDAVDQPLTHEAARSILKLDFMPGDQHRMGELAQKAQQGLLTDEERAEADEYRRAADVLALLQSQARRSLAKTE
jgi:hypothetical protein